MLAVRQYNGAMDLEGVLVCEDGESQPPTLAFVDEFRQIEMELLLAPTQTGEGFTWHDVLTKLAEAANWITVRREVFDTDLTAAELLEASVAAYGSNKDPETLPKTRADLPA